MKVEQLLFQNGIFHLHEKSDVLSGNGQTLVLAFGAKGLIEDGTVYHALSEKYPYADIVLTSTSGEIYDDKVLDDTVSIVAMEFVKTTFVSVEKNIKEFEDSFTAGRSLFATLNPENLTYVLVISDGSLVNGSELVSGMEIDNVKRIPITGGIAGDAANFKNTLVGLNTTPKNGALIAIGFYGTALQIAHGSLGGWDVFGPEKKVTKSNGNRLYEIDGNSALDLYKKYLGKYADDLPGSALLFPLSVRLDGSDAEIVRTILSIDDKDQSMIFAGDIPEGAYVRLMKANFDKLVDAAQSAAANSLTHFAAHTAVKPKLALLISCVGRKLILGKRSEEEIEVVRDVFGNETILTGFYSYGEISPLLPQTQCVLHNQTMTITTFNEFV